MPFGSLQPQILLEPTLRGGVGSKAEVGFGWVVVRL